MLTLVTGATGFVGTALSGPFLERAERGRGLVRDVEEVLQAALLSAANSRTSSIEKARRELGYEARFTYREGLPLTLEWFRSQSLLPLALVASSNAS